MKAATKCDCTGATIKKDYYLWLFDGDIVHDRSNNEITFLAEGNELRFCTGPRSSLNQSESNHHVTLTQSSKFLNVTTSPRVKKWSLKLSEAGLIVDLSPDQLMRLTWGLVSSV